MALRFSALRSLRLSLSCRRIFPLSPSPSLLSVCRILPLVSSPQRSRLSPSPHSPRCCGRLARIPRLWTWVWLWRRYLEDCGLLAGGRGGGGAGRIGRKSSELSAHQILVGGELGQILRAERSSNLGRRVVRIKSSKLSSHQMPAFRHYIRPGYGYCGTICLHGPAAADGHGVGKAACEHFRGYGLWLGTDTLHPRVSEGPRRRSLHAHKSGDKGA